MEGSVKSPQRWYSKNLMIERALMKLILYADNREKRGNRLETLIHEKIPGIQIIPLSTIDDLSQSLCRPLHQISIAVIFIFSQNQIKALLPLEPLFDDIRIVLIISSGEDIPMAAALELKPSFVSFPDPEDSDFEDVLSVLRKIQTRIKKQSYQHRISDPVDWYIKNN